MRLSHLELRDFRGYEHANVPLSTGVTVLLGRNGQGKTNMVEAAGYVATLASHRVATDAPLIRHNCTHAVLRATVVRDGHDSLVELDIVAGRANRARLNRSAVSRQRDVLGTLRTVLFAPEDLALVKGDPAGRRAFLDDLLVARQPRWSAVRSDYEKALKQRNAVLRTLRSDRGRVGHTRRAPPPAPGESAVATLDVFTTHLAQIGSALTYARLRLLHDLQPYLEQAYAAISGGEVTDTQRASARYQSSLSEDFAAEILGGSVPSQDRLREAMMDSMDARTLAERERGVCLVGPHRDDLRLGLGPMPAKGYASHGESWSIALALKIASFRLLQHDLGTDPVLILDDVFAELDAGRRRRLAQLVTDCEQVLITAAVAEDVPDDLAVADVYDVHAHSITRQSQHSLDHAQPEPTAASRDDVPS
ncbi:MAG: DNA replication/repair protein RecF [Ornithinimicrobium sp.]